MYSYRLSIISKFDGTDMDFKRDIEDNTYYIRSLPSTITKILTLTIIMIQIIINKI